MELTLTLHCEATDCTNQVTAPLNLDTGIHRAAPDAVRRIKLLASDWDVRPMQTADGDKVVALCPSCADTLATKWARYMAGLEAAATQARTDTTARPDPKDSDVASTVRM